MVSLTGCTGALTSGAPSGSSSSSSGSDSSYVDEEEENEDDPIFDEDALRDDKDDSSASSSSESSSASSSSSEYGTLDPEWRSSVENGYRVFDTAAIDDWQVPTPEIEDLVDRIEAKYELGLEFIETQEDEGGWRYIFQDADAQDDRYGGNSLEKGLPYIAFAFAQSGELQYRISEQILLIWFKDDWE